MQLQPGAKPPGLVSWHARTLVPPPATTNSCLTVMPARPVSPRLQLALAVGVVRDEGLGVLYCGVGASVLRSFVVGAVRLGTYPWLKEALGGRGGQQGELGFGGKLAAGSTAGALAALAGQQGGRQQCAHMWCSG